MSGAPLPGYQEPWLSPVLPSQCDQVMEFSWSALWNITDETPDNCEMFLNFNGMKLFLDCLKVVSTSCRSSCLSCPHGPSAVPRLPRNQICSTPHPCFRRRAVGTDSGPPTQDLLLTEAPDPDGLVGPPESAHSQGKPLPVSSAVILSLPTAGQSPLRYELDSRSVHP